MLLHTWSLVSCKTRPCPPEIRDKAHEWGEVMALSNEANMVKMANIRQPTTILTRQCPQGYRRDCTNRKTCVFRHIDENVGDPIKHVKPVGDACWGKLSPLKKAKVAIERMEKNDRQERGYEPDFNVTGLRNVDGTSCYINAVIQGLNSLHPFIQKLIAKQPTEEQKLTEHLRNTILEITSGQERFVNPIKMVEQIKTQTKARFGNGRQEDAVMDLLERLQTEEIDRGKHRMDTWDQGKEMENVEESWINDLFYGIHVDKRTCMHCKKMAE